MMRYGTFFKGVSSLTGGAPSFTRSQLVVVVPVRRATGQESCLCPNPPKFTYLGTLLTLIACSQRASMIAG